MSVADGGRDMPRGRRRERGSQQPGREVSPAGDATPTLPPHMAGPGAGPPGQAQIKSDRVKLAEKYLAQAKSTFDSANKVGGGTLLALLIIWLGPLEGTWKSIEQRVITQRSIRKQLEKKTDLLRRGEPDVAAAGDAPKNSVDKLRDNIAKISHAEQVATNALDEELITFKVFGVEFQIAARWAPVVWSSILAGLLFYLLQARRKIINLSARSVRILVHEQSLPLTDVASDTPWWVAPLPKAGAASPVSRRELHSLFGWSEKARLPIFLVFLFLASLVLIQGRVCWLSAAFRGASEISSAKTVALNHPRRALSLLSLGVTVLLQAAPLAFSIGVAWFWFRSRTICDHQHDEPATREYSRRDFLALTALSVPVLSYFAWFGPRNIKFSKNPRFVDESKKLARTLGRYFATTLAQGFHLNPASNVIHWVDDKKRIREVRRIDTAKLLPTKPVRLADAKSPQVHLTTASRAFEEAVKEPLSREDHGNACLLLVIGLEHDARLTKESAKRPNFRLHDLLAAISARHGLPEYLKMATDSLASYKAKYKGQTKEDKYVVKLIDERTRKWSNPRSHWFRSWTDPNRKREWPDLLT
jgi:hypothetical protein